MEYDYPLDISWSIEEIITVTRFYNVIEEAYETGINSQDIMSAYKEFKNVVNSIAEEKNIDKEFQMRSGYSIYQTIKKAKTNEWVFMGGKNHE